MLCGDVFAQALVPGTVGWGKDNRGIPRTHVLLRKQLKPLQLNLEFVSKRKQDLGSVQQVRALSATSGLQTPYSRQETVTVTYEVPIDLFKGSYQVAVMDEEGTRIACWMANVHASPMFVGVKYPRFPDRRIHTYRTGRYASTEPSSLQVKVKENPNYPLVGGSQEVEIRVRRYTRFLGIPLLVRSKWKDKVWWDASNPDSRTFTVETDNWRSGVYDVVVRTVKGKVLGKSRKFRVRRKRKLWLHGTVWL